MEFHDAANIFPMMTSEEMAGLVESISQGYDSQFPILTYESKILDGRNRYVACLKAGVEPVYSEWTGSDPVGFVVRANLDRRHLTSSQKAAIALEVERQLSAEAKKNESTRTVQGYQRVDNPIYALEQAAKMMGTNRQYVADAKKIEREAPELLERVRTGEMTIPEVKREMRRAERVETIQEATSNNKPLSGIGRFAVIYADPPWEYEHMISDSRVIENHYPTMSLQSICDLPVSDISNTDCVLFMWATNPKLTEAMRVLDAWGFNYRTNMVWVKDKIGMGYYARQQHELLLIATRGNLPVPEPTNRRSSVVMADRTEHSRKPAEFYEIIERMYPEYNKVELFSRNKREGWEVWGNQS